MRPHLVDDWMLAFVAGVLVALGFLLLAIAIYLAVAASLAGSSGWLLIGLLLVAGGVAGIAVLERGETDL